MIVVSNTSPLTNLAAIGQFDLLRRLYSNVNIANGVWDELNALEKRWPGSDEVESANWIQRHAIQNHLKAIYYGQVELISGVICDGYILDDQSAVMSGRGTAKLLDMDHKTLEAMGGNWPPKTLKSFVANEFTMGGNYVEVVARNSPYCGRKME